MSRSIREVCRIDVIGPRGRRIGRIGEVVFAPGTNVVAGYVVHRPRILFVWDRKDRILARDRVTFTDDGGVVEGARDSWDAPAGKRLGIDWDDAVIWEGMPVRTESGERLGAVRDALFDPETGRIDAIGLTGGATADIAVGVRDVEAALVKGFDGEAVVVADSAAAIDTSGGAAAAAGRGAAVAKAQIGEAAKGAAKAADTAARYTKSAARVAAKSDAGKKAVGWLKALKDEVVDAMGDPDDE